MVKKIKRGLTICGIILLITLTILYFSAIRNASSNLIFFSSESALKFWKIDHDDIMFEYKDEYFYICFRNIDFFTYRQDTIFWVADDMSVIQEEDIIHSAVIQETLYIYGTTKRENIKELKVFDSLLNEKESTFHGQWVDSIDTLCFCVALPVEKNLKNTEWLLADQNNNIISGQTIEDR